MPESGPPDTSIADRGIAVAPGGASTIDRSLIDTLRIYPPLGIARVGNAEDDYLIGPEIVGGPATHLDGGPARYASDFRSEDGSIRRQAARFRVYAHLRDGSARELIASQGCRIEWRVAIANLKAGWYEFNQAMDLPRGISKEARRRNESLPAIPGGRAALDIVPTPRSIEGSNKAGPRYRFDDGIFWHKPVYLGELRTDAEGRLIFLGGKGQSAPFRPGFNPTTFANNTGWHDDVSDGPVRATVTFPDGTSMEAQPAYVAVTPPNFAPGLFGLVTLDDTVTETFYGQGWLKPPASSSFTKDIWPIFDRLTGLQWVNHGLFVLGGHGSPLDARDPAVIDRLRDASPAHAPWRRVVLGLFRSSEAGGEFQEALLPQIYGDAYGESETDTLVYLSVTSTQYQHLERWAKGEITDDWPGEIPTPVNFEDLPPLDQITHLRRASLHDCLGGPFHPGIELTWTMRLPRVWTDAYRLNILDGDEPAHQDYGELLTPAVCTGAGGPYDGIAAGALTRFLGVPWQTDGTSCNSAADYAPATFLSMPTFWGARVPDQVLAEANYQRMRALDPAIAPIQGQKHFMLRVDWLRDVRGFDYYRRLENMINEWWQLGMVLPVAGAPTHLPPDLRVEQGRHPSHPGSDLKRKLVAAVEALAHPEPVTAAHAASGFAAKAKTEVYRPPKRRFRQGEI